MRMTIVIALLALAAACTREEPSAARPSPTPRPTGMPTGPAAKSPAAAGIATPAAAAASPEEEFEWDLATEAEDEEFEIDAAATAYYAPAPAVINFKAKALNGTPPVTFSWNFGDGSPKATGELVTHTFAWVGMFTTTVVGTDAQGQHSQVTLILRTATPEEFVTRMRLDPELLKQFPSPAPSPLPSATP